MSIMDRAQRVHARSHLRLAGEAVTYTRTSDGAEATLTVVKGDSSREQSGDSGLLSIVKTDDVHARTSDFESVFGSGARPVDGDVIEMGGRSYKVRPFGGEPGWRYSDQSSVMMRIHLKDEGAVV